MLLSSKSEKTVPSKEPPRTEPGFFGIVSGPQPWSGRAKPMLNQFGCWRYQLLSPASQKTPNPAIAPSSIISPCTIHLTFLYHHIRSSASSSTRSLWTFCSVTRLVALLSTRTCLPGAGAFGPDKTRLRT